MSIPLYNKYGNNNSRPANIYMQLAKVQKDPGYILDILLQNNKITQQQYDELQPVKNNPQQIFNYLHQHGNANQLNQAAQMMKQ